MSTDGKYDVAIVGAGPSGSWTATLLARRGARVLLVDPSHPREKPCGGGITGRAIALLGDAISAGLPSVRIRSAQFVDSRDRRVADVLLPTDTSSLVVSSRAEFDGALLGVACRAGANLLPARVADVTQVSNRFELTLADRSRVTTSFLVGADGANSLVRRKVNRPFRRDQLSIATGYYAHGVSSEQIVIEMVANPPGYIWSFPRPDHLAIGICAQADAGIGAERDRKSVV